jgi:hypothetical protein
MVRQQEVVQGDAVAQSKQGHLKEKYQQEIFS